jgi:hypothetical protein
LLTGAEAEEVEVEEDLPLQMWVEGCGEIVGHGLLEAQEGASGAKEMNGGWLME